MMLFIGKALVLLAAFIVVLVVITVLEHMLDGGRG